MPRILFITHHFPPDTSIGSKRAHRIASQLSSRGWDVDVLCAQSLYHSGRDDRLIQGLESVTIKRTHAVNPRAWAKGLHQILRSGATDASSTGGGQSTNPSRSVLSSGVFRSFSEGISRWLEVPDDTIGWLPVAVAHALTRPRPDLVLTTLPHFSNAIVASSVAKTLKVPLVLDFRDPWAPKEHRAHLPKPRQHVEEWLEDRCLRNATTLITVTNSIAKRLEHQTGLPTHVVTNACEPERLATLTAPHFERPTLVYAGALYGGRTLGPVLESIARLRDQGLKPEELGLLYMGPNGTSVTEDMNRLNVEAFVDCQGLQPNDVALSAMLGAAANLVLVSPAHAGQIPGKLFDAIATQRPVLSIVPPDSDTQALMNELNMGECVHWSDADALDKTLKRVAEGETYPSDQPIPDSVSVAATMTAFDQILRETLEASTL